MNSIQLAKIQNRFSENFWNVLWGVIALITFCVFAHRAWFIEATDFVAYYNAGSRILHSAPLYVLDEATPFKYLPFSAYIFVPFSLLPFKLAKMLFFVGSFLASVLVYRRVIAYYGHLVAILLFISFIRFHNYDFLNSQVNQILLWLLMNYLWDRNIKPVHSALSFALLSTFKVTPLLILIPLVLMRRFKEALSISAIFLIFCIIPLFHMEGGLQIYRNWYGHMKATTPMPVPDWDILQSVPVALWYWTKNQVAPETFKPLFMILSLGLIGWAGFSTLQYTKNLKRYPSPLDLVENAILSGFMILTVTLSPLAWKHNYLLVFPAVLSLVLFSRFSIFGLQLFMLTIIPGILGNFFSEWVHRSYIMVWGAMVVFFALFQIPWIQFRQKVQVWLYSTGIKNNETRFLTLQTNAQRGNFWQPITGSVEPGETSTHAAIREAKEETNFRIENTIRPTQSDFVFKKYPNHYYETSFYSKVESSEHNQVKTDPKEHSQFEWSTFTKACQLIKFDSNKNILKKIFLLIQRH